MALSDFLTTKDDVSALDRFSLWIDALPDDDRAVARKLALEYSADHAVKAFRSEGYNVSARTVYEWRRQWASKNT